MAKKVTRLFSQFSPENYKIKFKISEDKQSFEGSVVITGRKVGRPSQRITLHQKDLKIKNVKLTHTDKKQKTTDVIITRTLLQNTLNEVRIHSEQTLFPGAYTIELEFSGKITKNMDGVYPCFYKEGDVAKRLIATQFESHHAREAFPCIDEPEAKATFNLTLIHDKDEVALSNTPVLSIKNGTTTFEQTPIMSTYLLAFVVGELEYKTAKSKRGIEIRTYATKEQVEHTVFALDTAVKCLDFYEEYFDIPYPLAKCDLVALPDFASGAMENWGLITFREQTLLVDAKNTSLNTKQYVALVVAHELTHQWFGNLVTMRWWTDLWLNEGFASWMEYLAVDKLFPQWDLWTQFAVDEQQLAMKIDALEHTHPIEVAVKHPDEIRTIFDAISYQKGASVIHMLHDFLGPDDFRDGLRHYLKKYAYKNTDTIDLWAALEDASGKPVTQFMSAWTGQDGFPLIKVSRKSNQLDITQSRFVSNPTSKAREDKNVWPIPLLTEGLDKDVVTKKRTHVPMRTKTTPSKLNVGQTGFYRVDYSHELQALQLDELEKQTYSSIDRMGLLSDGFEVTKAGYQPVSEYLDLMEHYSKEDSLAVWDIIASSIGSIRSVLSKDDKDDSLRDSMKPFVRELTRVQLERLGWEPKENEAHIDTLLRPMIIGLAVISDEGSANKKAEELYDLKINKNGHINPDLRAIVYSNAARKGGQKEYDHLLELYKSTSSSDEKLSITVAMTSFEQTEIHAQVLELIKSDTIRLQDISYWIAYSFMNRHGREMTWKWLKENWDWLRQNLGTDLGFSRMPVYIARSFADDKFTKDFIEFFSSRMEPMLERSFNQGIEIAETASAWRRRDSQIALDWFRARVN